MRIDVGVIPQSAKVRPSGAYIWVQSNDVSPMSSLLGSICIALSIAAAITSSVKMVVVFNIGEMMSGDL